jgi:phosphatidylinositol alpha-1,6-mannosyltransferase
MKILYLATESFGGYGGISKYNCDLIEALLRIENIDEISLINRNRYDEDAFKHPKLNIVKNRHKTIFSYINEAFKASKKLFNSGIIICGHINLLPLAYLLSTLAKTKVVLLVYGIDVWKHPGFLKKLLCSRIGNIWSISNFTLNKMNEWANILCCNCTVIPNAINLNEYNNTSCDKNIFIEKYSIEGTKILLSICRLSSRERYKGIDEIIEIMPELLRNYKNLKYVIAGTGDDIPRLMDKVDRLGLNDSVKFIGYVNEADKKYMLSTADAFVMPGRGEGFGFVYLEAIACGLPTLGSTLDGSREALMNGKIGFLCNPDSKQSIIDGVYRCLNSNKNIPKDIKYYSLEQFNLRVNDAFFKIK